MSAAEKLFTVS